MRSEITNFLALGSIMLGLSMGDSGKAEETITIREQLNQSYGKQLISLPFSAKEGACTGGVSLSGQQGAVPAQLSDIEYWPDRKSVKSAKLYLVIDELKPLEARTYSIAAGAAGGEAAGLKIKKEKDFAEIDTGAVGVRLLLGVSASDAALSMKDVPGPLAAMKLGAGAWAGSSGLSFDGKVTAWKSELTDAGPVFARVVSTYTFEGGCELKLAASVSAGDSAVHWEMRTSADLPAAALLMKLPPVPGVAKATFAKGYGQWGKEKSVDIKPGECLGMLSPDTSIAWAFPEDVACLKLAPASGQPMQIFSLAPAVWSEPAEPLTYAGFKEWGLDMVPLMWERWKARRIPLSYSQDGVVSLSANLSKGGRIWEVSAGDPVVGRQFDEINKLVLDWPADAKKTHPLLFCDQATIKDVWTRAEGDAELNKALSEKGTHWASNALLVLAKPAAERKKEEVAATVDMLRKQLAMLGNFDVMRLAIGATSLYDAIIDSDLVTPQDKALFRAQMAYLGYRIADPSCWSVERGYNSGNPNMSISYTLSLGIIACVLPDHPMAKEWSDRATKWMDRWLATEVGPNGEWIPEGSHYGHVSFEPLIVYAIAAKRAGYHDFSTDQRLQKMALHFAKHSTPPDQRRANHRATSAYGRGTSGDVNGVYGVTAVLFKDANPELSKALQWLWNSMGNPVFMADARLGGYEPYYQDRRLPAEAPKWDSENFPELGVLMRNGFNTTQEGYLSFINCDSLRNLDVWVAEIGGINQWYGRGKPLSTCFTFAVGYNERHELLRNGVRLARNWGAAEDSKTPFGQYTARSSMASAFLPASDYARTTFTNTKVDDRDWFPEPAIPAFPKVTPAKGNKLEWTRQVLYLKDQSGSAWIALRDTTSGGEPTAWQFWTLSEKLGSAEQAAKREAFLADKPGQKLMPASELPAGNRYTAVGKFGVDVEYFIASPTNTPRHTLRYGGTWGGNRIPEYQDLLHLQLPGDGAYFVAVYPRQQDEAAPAFSTMGNELVIKAALANGVDYAFLSPVAASAEADGISFKGTAASLQLRGQDAELALSAAGEVKWTGYSLAAVAPVAMKVAGNTLAVTLQPGHEDAAVIIGAPGEWAVKEPAAATLAADKGVLTLTAPKGADKVVLTKK